MSQQGGRLCFYITFLMFCTHEVIGVSSLIALRIPEGVFLTDYMIWVQGFSHCSCQNCLVILSQLCLW